MPHPDRDEDIPPCGSSTAKVNAVRQETSTMTDSHGESTLHGPTPRSPGFLSLPPEIRKMIYEMALVCDRPLDLWPDRFVGADTSHGDISGIWQRRIRGYSMRGIMCNCPRDWSDAAVEEDNTYCWSCETPWFPFHEDRSPELMAPYLKYHIWVTSTYPRIRRAPKAKEYEDYYLKYYVRDQYDLTYIRKNLAAGIMRSCKLIHAESVPIFYGASEFQFRGHGGWQGLLRLFLTIGSFARQQIKSVLVPIPTGLEWGSGHPNHRSCPRRHLPLHLDGRSKNDPKLRMVKIQPEGPEENSAVKQVVEVLVRDNVIKCLTLYLPKGCCLGESDEAYRDGFKALKRTQGLLQNLKFCEITLTIGPCAYLGIEDAFQRIWSLEWNLSCDRVGFIRDPDDSSRARALVERAAIWLCTKYSYLEGIPTLFGADNEDTYPAPSTLGSWVDASGATVPTFSEAAYSLFDLFGFNNHY